MDLEIEVEKRDGYTVIKCSGELDTYNCGKLRSVVTDLVDKEDCIRIVIDLSNLEYVDSTGLGCLFGIYKRINENGGKIAMICFGPQLLEVFKMTSMDTVFNIVPTLAEAVDFVTGKSLQII